MVAKLQALYRQQTILKFYSEQKQKKKDHTGLSLGKTKYGQGDKGDKINLMISHNKLFFLCMNQFNQIPFGKAFLTALLCRNHRDHMVMPWL